ncbi:hypothetical protein SAMN05444354_12017 [Stigmatella aurantiaca]|uniref:Uncharacterized protein n=1 Tax=Stigmatella aurantiaca TaxID=41 RepID=A0A1H7ZYC9_STIAU|nr:hypothetical protein [Stigmatella aurantiaca]SEM63485.1 hypothetical protein SAMN05444354_12017 [Stigmatella aurantiaca]
MVRVGGKPYSDEKEGVLIQNICPVAGHEAKQENTGSTYLGFHTEDGFHPDKPDCLMEAPEAKWALELALLHR